MSVLLDFLKSFPPEMAVFLSAASPVFELRVAIPLGLTYFKLDVFTTFFWAVAGNIFAIIMVTFLLEWSVEFLSERFVWAKKFFNWLFTSTHKKTHKQIEKYGRWGLLTLVAIPLPMTGGWTGVFAAFLFGIKKKESIPIISAGIMIAGILVTVLMLGFNLD